MYAKLFQQVLTSSLTENEPIDVRGVFFMLMAAADKSGNVLGSDSTIARIINVPLEQFKTCMEALLKPDPASRSPEFEGRRVVPLERGLGYLLPGYVKYSGTMTDDQRREYFRVKQIECRARKKEAEATLGMEGKVLPKTPPSPNRFDEFWRIYPRRQAKTRATQAWKSIKPPEVDSILKHVCDMAMTEDWKKEGGKYVPLPASYLNGRRWEDEGIKNPTQKSLDELVREEWKGSM